MINELLTCLDLYKIIILRGYVQKEYEERANRVLDEISLLEKMISTQQVLNSYDFKTLKRDVSSIFHPDRFQAIPGLIDDVDGTLGIFNGAIQNISDEIKKGFEFRVDVEEQTRDNQNSTRQDTRNAHQTYSYDRQEENGNTVFTYISRKFNVLFRNIPSNEEDYDDILQRYNKKIGKLRTQLENVDFEIENIKKRIAKNIDERFHATSPARIEEEYKRICDRLYHTARRLYGQKNKYESLLNARFSELTPLMYAKEQEWNYRYTALLREHEQLTRDYESAIEVNDKKQIRVVTKRLNELNVEIATETKYMQKGLKKEIADEVTSDDYTYQDLLRRFKDSKKKFEVADKKYKRSLQNPDISREEIRDSIEEKFSQRARRYSEDLIDAENRKKSIEGSIERVEEEKHNFKVKYSRFAPKTRRR